MSSTSQVPLWVAVLIAVFSPVLAFAGVLVGQWLGRKEPRESEIRWRREETMRMLRWAAELSSDRDPARSAVGVAALDALDDSPLLQVEDQALITAVLESIVSEGVDEYDESDGTDFEEA